MKYTLASIIGEGSFGDVFLAYDEKDNKAALKRLSKEKNSAKTLQREVKMMSKLEGEKGVCQLLEYFEDEKYFWMAFSFIEGEDLLQHLESAIPFDETEALFIFVHVAHTIKTLHDKEIIHQDIKCENIMWDPISKTVTLIDFGFSEFSSKGNTSSHSGSKPYMCPLKFQRLYRFIDYNHIDGFKSDIWSLGTVLFTMLYAAFPWSVLDRAIGLREGSHPPLTFPFTLRPISSAAKDLLTKMLTEDPDQRLSIEEVLAHPWLEKVYRETFPVKPHKKSLLSTILSTVLKNPKRSL